MGLDWVEILLGWILGVVENLAGLDIWLGRRFVLLHLVRH